MVPVNSLRNRKYVLRKLASMFQFPRTFIQIPETKVLAIAKIPNYHLLQNSTFTGLPSAFEYLSIAAWLPGEVANLPIFM